MRTSSVGGDTRERDPEKWRYSIVNPGDWRVILREGGLLSVFEFLPPDLKDAVDRIWVSGRQTAWGFNPARKVNKLPEALDYSVPLFWTKAGVEQVTMVHLHSKLVLQAKNGAAAIPEHAPHVIPPQSKQSHRLLRKPKANVAEQRFEILPIEQAAPDRSAGFHWTHCDPAPLGLETVMGTDARENETLWRFEYSGDLTRDGEPLYWIVSQDAAWRLAAFEDQRAKMFWAKLWPKVRTDELPGSSRAAWVAYPADPTGLRGPTFATRYLLWNPVTQGFLGAPIELSGHKGWVEPAHDEAQIVATNVDPRLPSYEIRRYHQDRREFSEGTVSMKRFSISRAAKGIEDVYDLPEEDFLKLCWDIKPYTYKGG